MTYNDILIKANELIVNYYKKYEREPNAILMNEEVFTALKVYTAGYYAIELPEIRGRWR